jgi:hypothetical protein
MLPILYCGTKSRIAHSCHIFNIYKTINKKLFYSIYKISDKKAVNYYNSIKVFRIDKLHICSSFNSYVVERK